MSEALTAVQWGDYNYVLLDAASMGGHFKEAAWREKRHFSLFSGETAKQLAAVAPYLFQFDFASNFGGWLLTHCPNKAWAGFLKSSEPIEDLRMHLRKFLMVRTQEGKNLYYRFYDPRVLRDTLPTFDADIQCEIMGPIQKWLVETTEPGEALCFQLQQLRLKAEIQRWKAANAKQ